MRASKFVRAGPHFLSGQLVQLWEGICTRASSRCHLLMAHDSLLPLDRNALVNSCLIGNALSGMACCSGACACSACVSAPAGMAWRQEIMRPGCYWE